LKTSLGITSTWDVIGVRLKVGLVNFQNIRDDIEIVFIGIWLDFDKEMLLDCLMQLDHNLVSMVVLKSFI